MCSAERLTATRNSLLPTKGIVVVGIVVVAFVAAGCAPPAAREPVTATRRLELIPCDFDADLECGRLQVWEDRQRRSGRSIELQVVVARARAAVPSPDPIFHLVGGPGAGAAQGARGAARFLAPFRQNRDLVFVDQRGTGSSHRLDCAVPGSMDDLQGYFDDFFSLEIVDTCRRELEQKADLRLYHTAIAADDLDEVRAALGYDRINLMGESYGTRLAQVYLRRHPERVRSAVLFGTSALGHLLPLYHAREAQRGMELLLAACAADEACHAAFPGIEEELWQVLERLGQQPAEVGVNHPETGERVTVTLGRDPFAEVLRFLSYTPSVGVALPYFIHNAWQGDLQPFAQVLLATEIGFRRDFAWGMHLCVLCSEDVPFYPQNPESLASGTYLGDYRIRLQLEACSRWPRDQVSPDFHEPVSHTAPVLLIVGRLDPVTPPEWSERARANLPNSKLVVIEHSHHSEVGLSNPECLEQITRAFIDSGSSEGLDTTCVETMHRPPFITDRIAFDRLLQDMAGR